MQERINNLKAELDQYKPQANGLIDWGLVKNILSAVVDLLQVASVNLPAKFGWLSPILSLVASLLKQLISSLPDSVKE